MQYRTSLRSISIVALAWLTPALFGQGHGQGPVEPGPVRIDGLNLGSHWFGAPVDLNALRGKVVLFEIWGS